MKSDRVEKAFAYWKSHPVEATKDWFKFTPEDYQGDIINDTFLGKKNRTVSKSSHGVGKTALLSVIGWLFLNFFEQSRLVATAPTFSQLHDALWPEYAKWHLKMPHELSSQWDISGNHIRNKAYPKTWFAVSRTSNKPSNLQGFHGTDIMIQCDEGSGVVSDVFEVIEGIMSDAGEEGHNAFLLMMGNPNFNAGEFYNAFYRNKDLYNRYTISGDPSIYSLLGPDGEPLNAGDYHPEHGKVYVSKRVTQKYFDLMSRKYGRTSGVFDIRVRGIFPREEDDAIIPIAWAQKAAEKPLPDFDKIAHPVTIVMDVSRKGSNETVLGVFRGGHQVKLKSWPKTSTVQCEDILMEESLYWQEQGIRVERIIVDEPGVGGGVIDGSRRRGLTIIPYNGGESMKKDKDPEEDVRMFINRRARDYWRVRRLFELNKTSIINDEEQINQLGSIHYHYNEKNQKIQVESKESIKDRLGEDANLDKADVIVMGLAPWYSFASKNTFVAEDDIIYGEDRPVAEMDLF